MTAISSAPGASPTPSESGQLRDNSAIAVPKSNRRKKWKAELSFSFDLTTSGFCSSRFNMQADLPELLAPVSLLDLSKGLQKADQGERQYVIAEGAQQAAASQFHSKGEALSTPPNCRMTGSSEDGAASRIRGRGKAKRARPTLPKANPVTWVTKSSSCVTNRNRRLSPSQTR
ncbi:hypothetical protein MTO96_000801 [Rhipicephalus appendiculatus]